MPAVPPPSGPAPSAGPPLPDERALERVFRSHFSALIAEAKKHLKDSPAAAPHVVEGLFLGAWAGREEFKTAQQLEDFLHGEVAHAAARELSRRASAHHFGGSGSHGGGHAEKAASVDESWQRIHRTLHPDSKAAAGAIAAHSRRDAASHVAGLAKRRSYVVPITIGVIAIAAASGAAWWLNRAGREGAIVASLNSPGARPHQTGPGQFAIVNLDDGSKIMLAPQSKLVVPEHFGNDLRVVSLQGAATIDVAPGMSAPFELRADNAVIDVPGTSFVVRADTSDTAMVVFVKNGSATVRVGQDTKDLHPIASGAALRITAGGQVAAPTPDQLAEATSWTDSTVTIAHESLEQALAELRRWYGTHIVVLDSSLLTRDISIQAPTTSSMAAINAIEKSGNVKFEYEGETMVFRDATPAPTPKKPKKK
ncbi:MAG: FecR domain-containing protein [Gemmatimonadaceae bacterium]|nr:FecR domain-containing protein [Gemmatimonadaceae bacterium]